MGRLMSKADKEAAAKFEQEMKEKQYVEDMKRGRKHCDSCRYFAKCSSIHDATKYTPACFYYKSKSCQDI
jgi:hypothetical protein